MLDRERQFYAQHLSAWIPEHLNRFVVVKDEDIVGFFDSIDEALSAGAARYGMKPFLVRRVGEIQETVTVPALTLGLLRADP